MNTIVAHEFQLALRVQYTVILCQSSNLTTTQGSIVKVTHELIVISWSK
ncbi:hypothetical protein HOG27_03340 [bacterium]|nr:hypothetical protein [bacterium]MBT6779543.1 hypothetical protein [bacterium]